MDQTTQVINRVLPILFLIFLGFWIRRRHFLAENTIEDLRKIVVNIVLPSVLFISFLQIDLELAYLVIFVAVFLLCVALFGIGHYLQRRLHIQYVYFPFLMTGFEYGMLGVGLFGTAYGLEKVQYIAVVDLGHEIFIWFVFLALLLMKRDQLQNPAQLGRMFFTSPVIIAILASIFLNIIGAEQFLFERPVTGAIMATLQYLSSLAIPLILIIVGYGIRFDRHGIRDGVLLIAVRLLILIPVALLLNYALIRGLLDLEEPFEAALFTLLILPPPFIIPLYARSDLGDEKQYITNVLTLYTVVSIILYAGYVILNPTI